MSLWEYREVVKYLKILWCYLSTWSFMRIFGKDAGKKYHIIYFIKQVQDREIVFVSPKPKRERACYANAINLKYITPCSITRAMGYLVYSLGENVKLPPTMKSDVDTDKDMNISFVSLGGIGNLKTCDLLEDELHFHGFEFKGDSILWRGSELVTAQSDVVDYALIIKIHPQSNPERTWICCAGVGEWGTSGAAWFLARKWKEIHKWAKNKPFAIITETKSNSDGSTIPIHKFRNSQEIERFAKVSKITTTTTKVTTKTDIKQTTCTAAQEPMPSP